MSQPLYLVWIGNNNGYDQTLEAIFTSQKQALALVKHFPNNGWRIEERLTDTCAATLDGQSCFKIRAAFDGTYLEAEDFADSGDTDWKESFAESATGCWWMPRDQGPKKRAFIATIWAPTYAAAIEIFEQKRIEHRKLLGI